MSFRLSRTWDASTWALPVVDSSVSVSDGSCSVCFMDDTKEGFEGESWMFEFRPGNGFLRKKPSFVVWKETSSSLVLNVFECYSSWTGLSVLFLTTKFRDKGDESWVSLVGTDLRNGLFVFLCSRHFCERDSESGRSFITWITFYEYLLARCFGFL